jgi:hypothetical protein
VPSWHVNVWTLPFILLTFRKYVTNITLISFISGRFIHNSFALRCIIIIIIIIINVNIYFQKMLKHCSQICVTTNTLSHNFHRQQPRNVRPDATNGRTSVLYEVTNQTLVTEFIRHWGIPRQPASTICEDVHMCKQNGHLALSWELLNFLTNYKIVTFACTWLHGQDD